MRRKRTRISSKRMDLIRSNIKSKNIIKPGPWTNVETDLLISLEFKKNKSVINNVDEFLGIYRPIFYDKFEKTYPISFNLLVKDLKGVLEKNEFNKVISACEKQINSQKSCNGDKIFGEFFITDVVNINKDLGILSCLGKTTNKKIKGFMRSDSSDLRIL